MRKTKVLYAFLLLLVFCGLSEAQWVSVSNGMGSSRRVFSLYTSGSTLFSGTAYYGIYASTDGGLNWITTSYNSQSVYSFISYSGNLYAGTQSGIYVSSNGGFNWIQLGLNGYIIYSCAASGGNLFLGTQSGVFFSQNGGTNWTNTGLNIQTDLSLAAADNIVYCGTMTSGLFSTTNNGGNWVQTNLGNRDVSSVILSGTDIFCGTVNNGVYTGGAYFSSNNGANWTPAGLNNLTVFTLLKQGGAILAGTMSNGFYYSSNSGANWLQKNQGLPSNPTIRALTVYNGYLYAGVDSNSVWKINLSEITEAVNENNIVPVSIEVFQNYPNPFNPFTTIIYSVNRTSNYKITVSDIEGNQIAVLADKLHSPGRYSVKWDGFRFSSGVYFYTVSNGNSAVTKKMILLK